MLAVKITDTRDFMKKLLSMETFDTFEVSELSLTTYTTFRVDGDWHGDFFSDKPENVSSLSWRLLRPAIFQLIKGKDQPSDIHIVFRLSRLNLGNLIRAQGIPVDPDSVGGLFLNIMFSPASLTITTGTSMKVFSMDRTLEHAWDDRMLRFFRHEGIALERL